MKTYLECLPCMMNQALRAGQIVTDNEVTIKEILDAVGESIKDVSMHNTPAETGAVVYKKVREITGVEDPYKQIINDVTYQDAIDSGIGEVAKIISSGTTAPGTIMDLCTKDFVKQFEDADMIISKGQGNYEGLSNVEQQVFFLLKAKCHVIAKHIGDLSSLRLLRDDRQDKASPYGDLVILSN